MATRKASFEIRHDINARKTGQYMLIVRLAMVAQEAQRFKTLEEALMEIGGYVKEFPIQKKFKVEINV